MSENINCHFAWMTTTAIQWRQHPSLNTIWLFIVHTHTHTSTYTHTLFILFLSLCPSFNFFHSLSLSFYLSIFYLSLSLFLFLSFSPTRTHSDIRIDFYGQLWKSAEVYDRNCLFPNKLQQSNLRLNLKCIDKNLQYSKCLSKNLNEFDNFSKSPWPFLPNSPLKF